MCCCPSAFFSFISAFVLHSAFLSCTLQCPFCASYFLLLQFLAILERLFTFGKWSSFCHQENQPPPWSFFSNIPGSWKQETVSSSSPFQNSLGHSCTAGIKAGTHQKHPSWAEQPCSFHASGFYHHCLWVMYISSHHSPVCCSFSRLSKEISLPNFLNNSR